MVSKNNQWKKFQKQTQQKPHYGIRKLTVGVSSVLLGLSFMGGVTATNVKTAVLAVIKLLTQQSKMFKLKLLIRKIIIPPILIQ